MRRLRLTTDCAVTTGDKVQADATSLVTAGVLRNQVDEDALRLAGNNEPRLMTDNHDNQPLPVFFGHHKCATMSINTVIGAVCRRLGLNFTAIFDEHGLDGSLDQFVASTGTDFLSYGNADIEFTRQLKDYRGFHIIRDPRDIVVSAYFSHLYSHSTEDWEDLKTHRARLEGLSEAEGIMAEIEFRERSFRHMLNWNYDNERVMEVRFEDFRRHSLDILLQAFIFLGLVRVDRYLYRDRIAGLCREGSAFLARKTGLLAPGRLFGRQMAAPDFLAIAWNNSFQVKTRGREKGAANERSHLRKGASGDWRNYFSPDHTERFKELYPELVPALGYHPDDNW